MKKMLFAIAATFMAASGTSGQTFDINLKNGGRMNVEACNERIFRIKISRQKDFPESLMERYGLLKTDWDETAATRKDDGNTVTISTGKYSLSINAKSGAISAKDAAGKTVVESISFITPADNKIVQTMGESLNERFSKFNKTGGIIGDDASEEAKLENTETGDFKNNSIICFSLKDGERFYGGGNTSREHIQHRGEVLRMWATYQHTEIPMPFVVSSDGWGVFNNTTVRNYFDIGAAEPDKMFIYNTAPAADFYLFAGNSILDVMDCYTTVAGKSFLLPKWAYGLAFGGHMHEDMIDMMEDAYHFRQERVPCDLFWIEPQWMSKRYDFSTEKNWNYKVFPGEPYWLEKSDAPKTEHKDLFIGRLHGLGFKLALWLCIDFDQSLPEEDAIAKAAGEPLSGEEHWFDHLMKFVDQGVDGFKLDPARTLDEHPDRKYYNGKTDREMHNINQALMPKQMYQTFRNHTGRRSFHHYCGGWAGTQHWTACQSGDNGGGRTALFDQLNLSFSGFMNTSCDIMHSEREMESLHMGAFLPWVQINSWFHLLHPWYLPPEKKEMYRYYSQLRHDLFPYIYSAALRGALTSRPILQAMPFAFPNDRNVDDMAYQYMFGDAFMVGVFSDSIYLPEGDWFNYWTGEKIAGTRRMEKIDIPNTRAGHLFVREGSIIPFQKPMQYIGERPIDTLVMRVYPKGETSYTLYEDDGTTFKYEDGAIARTRFDCKQAGGSTTFAVQPVEGQYDGMPALRAYEVEMYLENKPESVTVNGNQADGWTYSGKRLFVTIPQTDIRKRAELKVY